MANIVLAPHWRSGVQHVNLICLLSHAYSCGETAGFWTRVLDSLLSNTLRLRQNGRHFPDDIFTCIFLNENVWISIKSSLKFVRKGPINNIPALVKGCVSLDPSKISKSGWWGLQLDAWQLCNSLWYGLINSKLHINEKIFFLYHTTSDGVTVQCFKSPSWPLRDGLDLWPQLIYTLSWESQHEEI